MNFAPVDPPAKITDDEPEDATLPRHGPVRDHRAGTTIGRYVLQERLGRGGMASVYRAVDEDLDELVAIKLLDARLSTRPEMLRRFMREAVIMREISSQNRHVVRARDFGTTQDGEAYMVMDYLRGTDLGELVQVVGPLDWPRLAPIALQLCDALAAVHARALIHRDIKPSNCFLADDGGQEVAKLIDFGICKDLAVGGELTDSNVVLGTPAYLAPEMLMRGVKPNVQTDIYALGVTLYYLLAGRLQYQGRAHELVAVQQQTDDAPPPSAMRPPHLSALPRAVDALVLRAIAVDPGRRHRSVRELADEIRRSVASSAPPRPLAGRALMARAAWGAVLTAGVVAATRVDVAPAAFAPWRATGAPLAMAAPPQGVLPPVVQAPGPVEELDPGGRVTAHLAAAARHTAPVAADAVLRRCAAAHLAAARRALGDAVIDRRVAVHLAAEPHAGPGAAEDPSHARVAPRRAPPRMSAAQRRGGAPALDPARQR
jgi:hypothetical protein